jgi:hypothetical protein
MQAQSTVGEARALVALAQADLKSALRHAQASYRINVAPDATAIESAIRAAAGLRDPDAVTDALRVLEDHPGRVPAAVRHEGEAVLAALAGRRQEALAGFLEAIRGWQELGLAVEAGFAQLNCLGLLGVTDAETRAVALDARQLFERLGARALLDRLAEVEGTVGSTGPPLRVGEAEVSATPQQ